MGRDDSTNEPSGAAHSGNRVPPDRVPPDRVFYDGTCGLCHAAVRFLVNRDLHGAFRFAPLTGTTVRECIDEQQRRTLPDSVVVLTADGRLLARSAAAVHLLERLGGGWAWLARALDWAPRPLADLAYRLVASSRRRFWSQPENQCPLVPQALQSRFDP